MKQAASAFVQENILKEKPNCSVVAPFSSSINNEMQIMSSNTVNQVMGKLIKCVQFL